MLDARACGAALQPTERLSPRNGTGCAAADCAPSSDPSSPCSESGLAVKRGRQLRLLPPQRLLARPHYRPMGSAAASADWPRTSLRPAECDEKCIQAAARGAALSKSAIGGRATEHAASALLDRTYPRRSPRSRAAEGQRRLRTNRDLSSRHTWKPVNGHIDSAFECCSRHTATDRRRETESERAALRAQIRKTSNDLADDVTAHAQCVSLPRASDQTVCGIHSNVAGSDQMFTQLAARSSAGWPLQHLTKNR